jgi:hypothetical protein
MFDSSIAMVVATEGAGVALLSGAMFQRELSVSHLLRPLDVKVAMGDCWLTGS